MVLGENVRLNFPRFNLQSNNLICWTEIWNWPRYEIVSYSLHWIGAAVQKPKAPVISLLMNVSCGAICCPCRSSCGVELAWVPQGSLWGAEKTFPFHQSIGRDRGAPFGEAVVGNLLVKCAQPGSPSWGSHGSVGAFQLWTSQFSGIWRWH